MKNKQAIVKFNIPDKTSQRTRHIFKRSSHDFKRRNYRPFSLFVTLLLFFTITLTSLKYFTKNTIAFQPDEFVTTWDVSHDNGQLVIHFREGSNNFSIDWGDGTPQNTYTQGGYAHHNYANKGHYQVKIKGTFAGIFFNNDNHDLYYAKNLLEINQWGNNKFKNTSYMFFGAENVIGNYVDSPDTSEVTTMENMFYGATKFNSPVNFDTRNVTNMRLMFYNAEKFNQPVNFNTENVTEMQHMFDGAKKFNQPLTSFNTSNVTNMESMFQGAVDFNSSLANFNTDKVTNMSGMFYQAKSFNQPVNHFNTSKVTTMSGLFANAEAFNQPIDHFDTRNVTSMSGMFRDAKNFNQSVSNFDTRNVTNIFSMFYGASNFDQSVSNFNTEKATNMQYMFSYATKFNHPVSSFNTKNVTDFLGMFAGASSFNQSVSNFNTEKAERVNSMFADASSFDQPIDNFNTSNVTNMSEMFKGAKSFNHPVKHFKTNLVTDMSKMFYDATAFNQSLDGWNTSNVVDISEMFYGAVAFNQPINMDFSKVDRASGMFARAKNFNQDISHLNYTFPSKHNNPLYNFVSDSGLSTKNYDKLLVSWNQKLPDLSNSSIRKIGNYNMKYCRSEAARQELYEKHWQLEYDRKDCEEYNMPPQDILLDKDNIDENTNPGTQIANISVINHPDDIQPDSNTVDFCHIAGQDDSDKFEIKNNRLYSKFSPNYEEKNEYHLCIKAKDLYDAKFEKQFTIKINDVNETPSVVENNYEVDENSPAGTFVGTVVATDPDQGQTHTFSIVGGNEQGVFEISNDGKITVKDGSKIDYETHFSAILTIKVTDSGTPALSSNGNVIIRTKNVDEAPYFVSTPVTSVSRRERYYYYFDARDPESQNVTYSVEEKPNWMEQNGQELSGTPSDADVEKDFTVRIKASDDTFEVEQTFTVHVNDRNLEPEIQSQEFTIDENSPNGTFIGQIVATDPNAGQILTYSAISGDTATFQVSNDGKLSVKNNAALDYERYEDHKIILVVQVTDNGTPNLSANNHITIHLRDVPEAPLLNDDYATVYENSENDTIVKDLSNTSPNPEQNPKFTLLSGNDLDIFELTEDGILKIKDNSKLDYESMVKNNTNTIVLRIRATNRAFPNLYTDFNLNIDVQDIDEPPYFTSTPPTSATKNILYQYKISVKDPDLWEETGIEIDEKPDWLNYDESTNTLSGTPGNAEVGQTYHVSIRAGFRVSGYQEFDIRVYDENHAPTFANQTFNIPENAENNTILGTITATDQDQGQSLTFSLLSGNELGIFELTNDGTLKVKDNTKLNYEKVANHKVDLRIKVTDNGAPTLSNEATVSINLQDVNEAPILKTIPEAAAKVNQAYTYQVVLEDEDTTDSPIFTVLSKPDWLNLDQATSTFSGTPQTSDANTNAELKMLISDGINQFEKSFIIHVESDIVTPPAPNPNPETPGNGNENQNQGQNQNNQNPGQSNPSNPDNNSGNQNNSGNNSGNQNNSGNSSNTTQKSSDNQNESSASTSNRQDTNSSEQNKNATNTAETNNSGTTDDDSSISSEKQSEKDKKSEKGNEPELSTSKKSQDKNIKKTANPLESVGKFIGDWWWVIIVILGLFVAKHLRDEQAKQSRKRAK